MMSGFVFGIAYKLIVVAILNYLSGAYAAFVASVELYGCLRLEMDRRFGPTITIATSIQESWMCRIWTMLGN
jgi:hypothetical protein